MIFCSCKNKENSKGALVEKKDTIEYMTTITLAIEDMHGKRKSNILADNDSIFYSSDQNIMYKNGKLLDSIPSEEIIKQYHLKEIDYKIFLQDNYKTNFSYDDCFKSIDIKLDSGQVTTLHSKKGSICQYIDVKNHPYIIQICSENRKYKINLGGKGNGGTYAQLYDIDKDGKEELVITENIKDYESCSLNKVIFCYKINHIDF